MKFHLRFDSVNEAHSRVTLFVNGANAGQLVLHPDEAHMLALVMERGSDPDPFIEAKPTFMRAVIFEISGPPITA